MLLLILTLPILKIKLLTMNIMKEVSNAFAADVSYFSLSSVILLSEAIFPPPFSE
jgi:hypothetical protein